MRESRHDVPLEALEAPTHQEVAQDVLAKFRELSPRYWGWVTILAFLFLLGIVGFAVRLTGGFADRAHWGYLAATESFILSTFFALPIVSAGLRLTKANWRRPFTRLTEIMAVTGVLMTLILIPLLAALPPMAGRLTIWFNFPLGAPDLWDYLAYGGLAVIGLFFLWTVALPDLAAARDHLPPSTRQRVISFLSLGWTGHLRQWRVHRLAVLTFGGFFLMYYPLAQTLMSSDFYASLVPGWKDAIFPATQTLGGIQGAAALTIVMMYVMRRIGGYEKYFSLDQFWALSKPLLALSILWFYFWWSSFITFWYGRQPAESAIIRFQDLDPYRWALVISFLLNFVGPLVALIWNPVRKSIWGPSLVAAGILLGTLVSQVRFYAASFSVPNPTASILNPVPPPAWPGAADILIVLGGIAGCLLMFLLVSKIIPVISIWEVAEGLHLVKVRKFFGRQVRVIAKSH